MAAGWGLRASCGVVDVPKVPFQVLAKYRVTGLPQDSRSNLPARVGCICKRKGERTQDRIFDSHLPAPSGIAIKLLSPSSPSFSTTSAPSPDSSLSGSNVCCHRHRSTRFLPSLHWRWRHGSHCLLIRTPTISIIGTVAISPLARKLPQNGFLLPETTPPFRPLPL